MLAPVLLVLSLRRPSPSGRHMSQSVRVSLPRPRLMTRQLMSVRVCLGTCAQGRIAGATETSLNFWIALVLPSPLVPTRTCTSAPRDRSARQPPPKVWRVPFITPNMPTVQRLVVGCMPVLLLRAWHAAAYAYTEVPTQQWHASHAASPADVQPIIGLVDH